MSNPGEHQGGDSEGMFLGDSIGSITGIEQTNLVSDGYSQVQEVVTEEIHQYQVSVKFQPGPNMILIDFLQDSKI